MRAHERPAECGSMSTDAKVPPSTEGPLKLDSVLRLDRCPQCGTASPHLSLKYIVDTPIPGDYTGWIYWAIYKCESCANIVAAKSRSGQNKRIKNNDTSFVTGELVKLLVEKVIPRPDAFSSFIPERPLAFLTQARDCVHSPAGCVMLSASAVDAMVKEKGLIHGSLYARIDEAVQQHLITEDMGKWAHQIRLDANDQRHADLSASLPDQKDAELCLEFAAALGEILFVLPARVKRGISQAQQGRTGTSQP
jgi:hypothetical protein